MPSRLCEKNLLKNLLSLVKDFLKNNIDMKDMEGRTALIHSAFCNNFELLNWLIKKAANINIRDNNENSTLHYAVAALRSNIQTAIDGNGRAEMFLRWLTADRLPFG